MAVFDALRRDGNASLDVPACNAAVDVLSRGGEMEAAERMASAAARMAEKQGGWVEWDGVDMGRLHGLVAVVVISTPAPLPEAGP